MGVFKNRGGEFMPTVRVELWSGRSAEFKADLAKTITDIIVEKFGCPDNVVTVKFEECPMEDWFVGGKCGTNQI